VAAVEDYALDAPAMELAAALAGAVVLTGGLHFGQEFVLYQGRLLALTAAEHPHRFAFFGVIVNHA
jgi:hypothetical protein